jgi:hypothetical protein
MGTCSILSAPSPVYLYPIVIASVVQLLLSDSRGMRLKSYQYALTGAEWLWGVLLFMAGTLCVDPESPDYFVMYHTALTMLTVTTIYLTYK